MKKNNKVLALLGKDTHFDGRLTFEGTVRIDGHFEGEISAVGNLIIGRGARVEADIQITCMLISGEVRGKILATQSVEVLPHGHIYGSIEAPNIVIHEGAVLQGHCQTQGLDKKSKETAALDLASEEPLITTIPLR
jgi:cytoskeletal protein CcmA (bactofilin family)